MTERDEPRTAAAVGLRGARAAGDGATSAPASAGLLGAGRIPALEDELAGPWWEGVRRGELLVERCERCERLQHPPRGRCAGCGSCAMGWAVSEGRGAVHSWVTCHYPRFGGYDYPYAVALAELDEGVRIVAEYRGAEPRCTIGERVAVRFAATADERVVPVLVPDDGAGDDGGVRQAGGAPLDDGHAAAPARGAEPEDRRAE